MNMDEAKTLLAEKIEYMKNLTDLSSLKYSIFNPIANVDDNGNIPLNYKFNPIKTNANNISNNIINILTYTHDVIFSNTSKNLNEYRFDNLKSDIDYIEDIQNFKNENGKVVDTNKEKINHFLNSSLNISTEQIEKNEYLKFKYTMLSQCDENNRIVIINRHYPIISVNKKGKRAPLQLYAIDYEDSAINLTVLTKDIFKQPIHPTILIIDNICFLISERAEELFGFTEYNRFVSNDRIQLLNNKNIFCNDNCLNSILNKKKYINQLSNVSDKVLKDFDINTHRQLIIEAGLTIENKKIVIRNNKDIEHLLDLLLARIEYENPISGENLKVRSSSPVKREE